MRISTLSSLVLIVLSAATGCTTRAAGAPEHLSTTPSNHVRVAEGVNRSAIASDPLWNPPEEMSFGLKEEPSARTPFVRSANIANALPAPNRREVVRGQLY